MSKELTKIKELKVENNVKGLSVSRRRDESKRNRSKSKSRGMTIPCTRA